MISDRDIWNPKRMMKVEEWRFAKFEGVRALGSVMIWSGVSWLGSTSRLAEAAAFLYAHESRTLSTLTCVPFYTRALVPRSVYWFDRLRRVTPGPVPDMEADRPVP